jgi:predicted membrane channel-forming protein YqfA (hemolysin III family)
MSILWFLIVALAVVVALGTIIDVFGRHLGAGRTAAWVLIVLLFPFIGAGFYWWRRPTSRAEIDETYLARAELRRETERRPFG